MLVTCLCRACQNVNSHWDAAACGRIFAPVVAFGPSHESDRGGLVANCRTVVTFGRADCPGMSEVPSLRRPLSLLATLHKNAIKQEQSALLFWVAWDLHAMQWAQKADAFHPLLESQATRPRWRSPLGLVTYNPSRVRVARQGASGLTPDDSAFTLSEAGIAKAGPDGTQAWFRGPHGWPHIVA